MRLFFQKWEGARCSTLVGNWQVLVIVVKVEIEVEIEWEADRALRAGEQGTLGYLLLMKH